MQSRGLWLSLAAAATPCYGAPIQAWPGLDQSLALLGQLHGSFTDSTISYEAGFTTGAFGITLTGGTFLLIETVMLLILELLPKLLSTFAARKICHAGTGLLMLMLDPDTAAARAAVWLIAVSSIAMTWNVTKALGIPPFRFGAEKDIGITIYLLIVIFWFYLELPVAALSPMFFADPSGAVVGKFLSGLSGFKNPAWYGSKTVCGSAAVFLVTFATLRIFYPPMTLALLLLLSVAAMLAEAVGGSYDNLCLAAVVIGGYKVLAPQDGQPSVLLGLTGLTSPDEIGIPAVVLVGFIIGSGVVFAMSWSDVPHRISALIVGEELLLGS